MAEQALSIANGSVRSVNGRELKLDADTICIHGDRPNAAAIGQEVRRVLTGSGIDLAPLRDVVG